jgi:DNA polymerase-3 subunit alpha
MVGDFVNRKHGRAEVAYPDARYQHESLKPILEPTYGVIVYQEQVMQIAQELAGYSLGEADLLRRAMGKKKPEEMAKQREVFESGAKNKGVDPQLALKIFDLVEKFAGYGFNKSHSAAYALVSYQTAWLKTHYTAEFLAATLSSELQNTDKIVMLVEECRSMGITVRSPDVNEGEYMFTVNDEGEIIYGLGAIKGLGEGPIESLIAARKEQAFSDFFDLCARVDARKVNKRALEALIRSGAVDGIGPAGVTDVDRCRAVMWQSMPDAVQAADQAARNEDAGMQDLFGEVVPSADNGNANPYEPYGKVRAFSTRERLRGEKETLGLYLTGHPIDEYEEELRQFAPRRIVDLRPESGNQLVAGLVVSQVVRKTRRGDMATLVLDDRSGRIEVTVFSDVFREHREKLVKDTILVFEGRVFHDDYKGEPALRASGVRTLMEARKGYLKGLRLRLDPQCADQDFRGELERILRPYTGGACSMFIDYSFTDALGTIELGDPWRVYPEDELLIKLRDSFGTGRANLGYQDQLQ